MFKIVDSFNQTSRTDCVYPTQWTTAFATCLLVVLLNLTNNVMWFTYFAKNHIFILVLMLKIRNANPIQSMTTIDYRFLSIGLSFISSIGF